MEKNQIIHSATALFSKKGIHAVSMEQIALEAGVQEQVVFAEFDDKGKLLEACLNVETRKMDDIIAVAKSRSESTLEMLILVLCFGLKGGFDFCPQFYKDLKRYPSAMRYLMDFRMKLQRECTTYFRQCIEEGYFKSNENAERMASFYIEEIGSLASKYQFSMIKTLVTGICSPMGIIELGRIKAVIEKKISEISEIIK